MPKLFNVYGFGPSAPFTERSTCPRVDHGVSGRKHSTSRHFKTRFRCGSASKTLSLAEYMHSPVHYAKGTPSPIPQRGIGLRPLVSVWFQVLFTRLKAVLFTFQSPYCFTIGHRVVFSLGRWSGQLRTEFHELRATLVRLSAGSCRCRVRVFHPLWTAFPGRSATDGFVTPRGARNPGTNPGLGYVRFRSPLLTESMSFSFPPGT